MNMSFLSSVVKVINNLTSRPDVQRAERQETHVEGDEEGTAPLELACSQPYHLPINPPPSSFPPFYPLPHPNRTAADNDAVRASKRPS